jgi:hypothetical protein
MRKVILVLIGIGAFALIAGSVAAAPITRSAISAGSGVVPAHWGYRGYGRGYYGRSYGHGYYGRSYGHGYYGRSYGRGYYGRRW